MNVYRHPNGGGKKVFPAQASPDSFLDRGATVEGVSSLYGSRVDDSSLKDTVAADSFVGGGSAVCDSRVVTANVLGSEVQGCEIVAAHVEGCRLKDCKVYGVGHLSPRLSGVRLVGVDVSGGATLVGPWGLELEGAHIHAGTWTEQPRHLRVEGENGVSVAVVECTEGRAHVGCECRGVEEWIERGPKMGRRLGWTVEQIELCVSFLKNLR